MSTPDLFTVSIIAFCSVLFLLSLLAGIMRLIIVFFPMKESGEDAAVVAAVTTAYSVLYPGTQLTKMEEVK